MDSAASTAAAAAQVALETAGRHLLGAKAFQLAAYCMLIYDTLITLSDEVERIWKRPFSGATALFLLNRWGTPFEFAVVVAAFHTKWEDSACEHFAKYEGAGTIALVGICEIIMILRVYALYRGNKFILVGLFAIFLTQVGFQSYALSGGIRAPLPHLPGFEGCILTGANNWFGAFWASPLVTDTTIFALTLWKTRQYFRAHVEMPTLELLLRDGVVYFFVIFSANLMNVIIYFNATADLKAVSASFSQLITSVMISRLVLNLRGLSSNEDRVRTSRVTRSLLFFRNTATSMQRKPGASYGSGADFDDDAYERSWVATHLVGNLGEELEIPGELSWSSSTVRSRSTGDIEGQVLDGRGQDGTEGIAMMDIRRSVRG